VAENLSNLDMPPKRSLKRQVMKKGGPSKAKKTVRKGGGSKGGGWLGEASRSAFGQAALGLGEGALNRFLPGVGTWARGGLKMIGIGAYKGIGNGSMLASAVPMMHSLTDRGVRVQHHEFLGDISSSTSAISILSYALNPGMARTFPWLAKMAAGFQRYKINGLAFFFKSSSANALNSTNTALGWVGGAVQYNVYDTAPISKQIFLNLTGAREGKPSEDNIYPVECSRALTNFTSYFIRSAPVADDMAKYDFANFHLAVGGSQAAAVVGELHVAYDVTLIEPNLEGNVAGLETARFLSIDYSNANPLGVTNTKVIDTIGASMNGTTISWTAQAGSHYVLTAHWFGTAATVAYPVTTLNGLISDEIFAGNPPAPVTGGLIAPVAGASVDRAFLCRSAYSNITGPVSISFAAGGTLPPAGVLNIWVVRVM